MSPFLLHIGMFVPTLFGQCTAEQQAMWLPRALSMQIVGAYVQVYIDLCIIVASRFSSPRRVGKGKLMLRLVRLISYNMLFFKF